MTKKKTLKKQEFSLKDIPRVTINPKMKKELRVLNPDEPFRNQEKVEKALIQCLRDNDTDTFMEILDAYLQVNRSHVAKKGNISRATVQLAFTKGSNPTLKTIAKIFSESARK